jgi:aryl-phospho-beta-D-glucosidase BglC (GH1 family)
LTRAQAQASHDLPSPYAFALPSSTFPPDSIVRGGRATERTLEAASGLHTVSLARFGHLLGYLQTGWWWPSTRTPGHTALASIQYMASIFVSPDQADAAYGNAQASLWELGYPMKGKVANNHPFAVIRSDGSAEAYLLLHQGPIELEFRLHYGQSIDRPSLNTALWYLRHVALTAWTRAQQLARNLPLSSPPASSNPFSDIQAVPWGAGPIVKSPSLMVLDAAQVGPETHLDPGTFRPIDGPALASHTVNHPRLVPPEGLQHFVQTASVDGGKGWYDGATLYETPQQAGDALFALSHANRYHPWLPPYTLDPAVWKMGRLSIVDDSRAWKIHGETIFVFRIQNLLMVLSEFGQPPDDMLPVLDQLMTTVPTYLHAQGTDIVTATGDTVRLASVNWYGAEENDFVLGGLDYQPYQSILQHIKLLGFNSIRLPYSNQLVEQDPVITDHVAANPELQGMHAMDILNEIIGYAGALGLSIILDDHRSDAGWSTQPDGLWYTKDYPESSFNRDWVTVTQRYAVNNVVIGADLRNEPHAAVSWGDGNVLTDWHAAAQRAGNDVLAANPHLLILVEGIQYYKKAISYWWGGSLQGVPDAPVVLHFADGSPARSQLVYSVHDYGPEMCGKGCPWFGKSATYASLSQIWEQYWGFVVDDPSQPYAAPIWVGEFGTCDYQLKCVVSTAPGSQGQWFSSLIQFIADKRVSWGYWAMNGTESTGGTRVYGTLDWYGFLDHTWTEPYSWLATGLQLVLNPQSAQTAPTL